MAIHVYLQLFVITDIHKLIMRMLNIVTDIRS